MECRVSLTTWPRAKRPAPPQSDAMGAADEAPTPVGAAGEAAAPVGAANEAPTPVGAAGEAAAPVGVADEATAPKFLRCQLNPFIT